MSKVSSTLLVIVVCVFSISAKQKAEKVFTQAKEYYRAGSYDSTVSVLRRYLTKHGKEKSTEYIVPLLMEALVRTNDYNSFNRLMGIYKRKFPKSDYIPRLYYLEGVVKAKEQEYRKAIFSFSTALDKGISGELEKLVVMNVERICESGITLGELNRVAGRSEINLKVGEIVYFYQIKMLYEEGHASKAKRLAEKYRKRYPHSAFQYDARKLKSKSRVLKRSTIQVGLLAPLTGENADIGKFVVQGVRLAVDTYNKSNTPKIDLVILDTRGNMVESAKKTLEMVKVHKTDVILGPVLSCNATVAASVLMSHPDVIMLTPTATDDGIGQLGYNVFQMNVTLGILGRKLARFSIENLNIKEFAIISPISEYGRVLTDNFKDEAAKRGGEVLAIEYFDEGTNDFRIQFESMRKKLAERKWEQYALEGRNEFSKEAKGARAQRAKNAYLADSTIDIGGIFIPAESEDVIKITSQVYFHRLRTQLLGSNGWHTNATILGGKRYVDNAIISTNFEPDAKNQKWVAFSKLYWDRFKENPDQVAAPLGYDAANLILNAITNGGVGSIDNELRSINNYHGVSGMISFDNEEGVNSEAAILKISNKKFIRIQ